MDEWIKKTGCIYPTEHRSALKKNKIMSFTATWVDLEIIILSEESQTEKDSHHVILLSVKSEKKAQMNLLQNRKSHRCRKLMVTKGKGGTGKTGRLGLTHIHYCT